MKKFRTKYRFLNKILFFLAVVLCLQVFYMSKAHADVVLNQKVSPEFIIVAVLVLGGEAFLVTWLFWRRGFQRKYLWGALFIVNLITWVIFLNVYRSIIKNIYLVEGSIVVLEGAAIFYLSRLPLIRSMSNKPVGILGATGSSVLGNLFSWGLGMLIFFLLIQLKKMQKGI